MNADTKFRALAGFSAVCLLALCVQGYFSWKMSHELNQIKSAYVSHSVPFVSPDDMFDQYRNQMDQQMEQMEKDMQWMMGSAGGAQALFNNPLLSSSPHRSLLDRLFGKDEPPLSLSASSIHMNETGDAYQLVVDVPKGQQVELNTEVQGNTLSVSGRFKSSHSGSSGNKQASNVDLNSMSMSEFSESITLPHKVDADKIVTKREDGKVTVTIPKS